MLPRYSGEHILCEFALTKSPKAAAAATSLPPCLGYNATKTTMTTMTVATTSVATGSTNNVHFFELFSFKPVVSLSLDDQN